MQISRYSQLFDYFVVIYEKSQLAIFKTQTLRQRSSSSCCGRHHSFLKKIAEPFKPQPNNPEIGDACSLTMQIRAATHASIFPRNLRVHSQEANTPPKNIVSQRAKSFRSLEQAAFKKLSRPRDIPSLDFKFSNNFGLPSLDSSKNRDFLMERLFSIDGLKIVIIN